ncbi:zinc ABC transporter substrate-binding protein [Salinibacterium sp. TMP30]|uniref:metal ABC transporter solute-binding protein, Zn/Mn family n=1 Tax=Salinibacterium sp. TMP30 TaxID=3138237 RepID=UPI0031394942
MSHFTSSRSLTLTTGAVLAVSALTLAGCSATTPPEDDGKIDVVASTSVYGSLVSTLGGDAVSVTSLIDNAAQDPHSYEGSARDQLAVSRADLVVVNGGGYDPFAEALYESSGASAILITAVDASGLLEDDPQHNDADEHTTDDGHDHIEGFNEHVWYSFSAMEHIAEHISDELTALDPASSEEFDTNLAAFLIELGDLESQADQISELAADRGAAVTEPVAVYLLEAVGLRDITPPDFSQAIEEGADVPPTALKDVLDLIESGRAALLAYNEQTASPETERVQLTATEEGVPVVSFTETLPEGSSYVEWMSSNLDALAAALAE